MTAATQLISTTYNSVTQTGKANDTPALLVTRNTNYTGGNVGYVNPAIQAYTTTSGSASNYEWAMLARLDNGETGAAQNTGSYAQARVLNPGVSPTWAFVAELKDQSGEANPTSGRTSVEIDLETNGSDTNINRVMVDIVPKTYSSSGSPAMISYGIRIGRNAGAEGNIQVVNGVALLGNMSNGYFANFDSVNFGINLTGSANVGADFSSLNTSTAAIRLALGQFISLEQTNQYQMNIINSGNGANIQFTQSGTARVSLGIDPSNSFILLQGAKRVSSQYFNHPTYTTATRPNASVAGVGATIVVTNPPGGVPTLAVSDGTSWHNVTLSS